MKRFQFKFCGDDQDADEPEGKPRLFISAETKSVAESLVFQYFGDGWMWIPTSKGGVDAPS